MAYVRSSSVAVGRGKRRTRSNVCGFPPFQTAVGGYGQLSLSNGRGVSVVGRTDVSPCQFECIGIIQFLRSRGEERRRKNHLAQFWRMFSATSTVQASRREASHRHIQRDRLLFTRVLDRLAPSRAHSPEVQSVYDMKPATGDVVMQTI